MKLAPNPEHYRAEREREKNGSQWFTSDQGSGTSSTVKRARARTSSPLATRLNYKSGQTQWSNGGNNSRPAAEAAPSAPASGGGYATGRAGGRAERAAYQQPASGRFNLLVRSLAHSLSCSRAARNISGWRTRRRIINYTAGTAVAIIIIIQLAGCTLSGLCPESR